MDAASTHRDRERCRHQRSQKLLDRVADYVPKVPGKKETKAQKLRRIILYLKYLKTIREKLKITPKTREKDTRRIFIPVPYNDVAVTPCCSGSNYIQPSVMVKEEKGPQVASQSSKGQIKEEINKENSPSSVRAEIIALAKVKPALSANIGLSWFKALEEEFHKDYFDKLGAFLSAERKKCTVYPPEEDVYSWTNACHINDVKVVILQQNPYHGEGQAHGLAFSVPKGAPIPPSLFNIFRELVDDVGGPAPNHGSLIGWAKQGVLLLNTCLTVQAGIANSHRGNGKGGWEMFTAAVLAWLNNNLSNIVFMLWGKQSKVKGLFINEDKHLVLTAPHPSPRSAHRGFYGCQHFTKANEYLLLHNKAAIDWSWLP